MLFLCNYQFFELSIINTSTTIALLAINTMATLAPLSLLPDEATHDTCESVKVTLQTMLETMDMAFPLLHPRKKRCTTVAQKEANTETGKT